jgi:hypothetical protein
MINEGLDLLCRTPCFSIEPVDICSHHGTSVVQTKKWVELNFLKLALASDATTAAF